MCVQSKLEYRSLRGADDLENAQYYVEFKVTVVVGVWCILLFIGDDLQRY